MNWQKLVLELIEAGLTQKEIGEKVGRGQSWVADVAAGKYDDLKWADGQKLIRLHKKTMRDLKKAA